MDAENKVQSKSILECSSCGYKLEADEHEGSVCESCGAAWEEIRHAHITLPGLCLNVNIL
jgi:rubrerythrin